MANAVTNYDIYFQMAGIMQFAQIILRPLQVGLINLGIIVFVVLIVLSMLLASAGWFIRRQSSLLERVEVLEDKLASDGFQPQAFKD